MTLPLARIHVRHGVDLVHVPRLREVMESHPRFEEEVFTEGERTYCRARPDPWPHFAARFAAKEAVGKALGIGMTRWREVEVVRGRGAPTIALHGRYAERADQLGVERVHVSLTHGRDSAVAFAVAESGGAPEERSKRMCPGPRP